MKGIKIEARWNGERLRGLSRQEEWLYPRAEVAPQYIRVSRGVEWLRVLKRLPQLLSHPERVLENPRAYFALSVPSGFKPEDERAESSERGLPLGVLVELWQSGDLVLDASDGFEKPVFVFGGEKIGDGRSVIGLVADSIWLVETTVSIDTYERLKGAVEKVVDRLAFRWLDTVEEQSAEEFDCVAPPLATVFEELELFSDLDEQTSREFRHLMDTDDPKELEAIGPQSPWLQRVAAILNPKLSADQVKVFASDPVDFIRDFAIARRNASPYEIPHAIPVDLERENFSQDDVNVFRARSLGDFIDFLFERAVQSGDSAELQRALSDAGSSVDWHVYETIDGWMWDESWFEDIGIEASEAKAISDEWSGDLDLLIALAQRYPKILDAMAGFEFCDEEAGDRGGQAGVIISALEDAGWTTPQALLTTFDEPLEVTATPEEIGAISDEPYIGKDEITWFPGGAVAYLTLGGMCSDVSAGLLELPGGFGMPVPAEAVLQRVLDLAYPGKYSI